MASARLRQPSLQPSRSNGYNMPYSGQSTYTTPPYQPSAGWRSDPNVTNGGYSGGGTFIPGEPTPGDGPTTGGTPSNYPPVDPTAPTGGGNINWLGGGFDRSKLDSGSEKYKLADVFRRFDPKGGITPDLLAALNALNIGDFSGSGDRLSVANARNGARWLSGTGDVIQNYTGEGDAYWSPLDTADPDNPNFDVPPIGGGGGGVPGGVPGGGGGGGPLPDGGGNRTDIWAMLSKLINEGGNLNNDILTRRVGRARDDMNAARTSSTDTYRAMLADRGLLGSGGEVGAASKLEQELAKTFGGQEQDIIADEAGRADNRMMQALSLATGMSMDDARNSIERYNADITRELGLGNINLGYGQLDLNRTLGLGNLALGNANMNQDWNKFMATFGLDREKFANEISNGRFDQLARLIDFALRGATISGTGRT